MCVLLPQLLHALIKSITVPLGLLQGMVSEAVIVYFMRKPGWLSLALRRQQHVLAKA